MWGIEVFAYCLMGNHYHLCVRTPEGNLSRVMSHVDGLYTQRFNRRHVPMARCFVVVQAILVDAERVLGGGDSLHSLERGGGGDRRAAGGLSVGEPPILSPEAKGVPSWLNTTEVVEQIGGRQAFHEFVLSGNEESLQRYYEAPRHSPILGGEQFIERVCKPGAAAAREHPRYERRVLEPGPDRVVERSSAAIPSSAAADPRWDEGRRE